MEGKNKFVSRAFQISKDGLQFHEIPRELIEKYEKDLTMDEKAVKFIPIQEQIKEMQKLETMVNDQVNRIERKKIIPQNVYERLNEYMESENIKQELYNEEDFDYFQYYGQLREMEERNHRQEQEEVRLFKVQRTHLVYDQDEKQNQVLILNKKVIPSKPKIKPNIKVESNLEPLVKKIKPNNQLVDYDSS